MISIKNKNNEAQTFVKGDYSLTISPFDNYQLFTIYTDNVNKIPIDLSTVGDLYINFTNNNDSVIIKEILNIKDSDKSKGEVLFKISKSNATKILNFNNNNFYISAKFKVNDSESEETVLFGGKWQSYDNASATYISTTLENNQIKIKTLSTENENLVNTNIQLTQDNTKLNEQIESLKTTIVSMQAELSKYKSSNVIKAVDLKDYISTLSKKGKNTKLSESEMEKLASSLSANVTTNIVK